MEQCVEEVCNQLEIPSGLERQEFTMFSVVEAGKTYAYSVENMCNSRDKPLMHVTKRMRDLAQCK